MKSPIELLKGYFANTSPEQIQADWAAVKDKHYCGGPTIDEFISWFPRNLQQRYKKRFKA